MDDTQTHTQTHTQSHNHTITQVHKYTITQSTRQHNTTIHTTTRNTHKQQTNGHNNAGTNQQTHKHGQQHKNKYIGDTACYLLSVPDLLLVCSLASVFKLVHRGVLWGVFECVMTLFECVMGLFECARVHVFAWIRSIVPPRVCATCTCPCLFVTYAFHDHLFLHVSFIMHMQM